MKYLILLSFVLFTFGLSYGQTSPVLSGVSNNCYRIDENNVSCDLFGLDRDIDLNNRKTLDSLFKAGQSNLNREDRINEYHGFMNPKGNVPGEEMTDVMAKRVIISREQKEGS